MSLLEQTVDRTAPAGLMCMARRVKQGDRDAYPNSLVDLHTGLHQKMESHTPKEEQILFPMLRQGIGAQAQSPIMVMCHKHDEHGEHLDYLMALTDNIIPAKGACITWHMLYIGLSGIHEDLMQYIHLEKPAVRAHRLSGRHFGLAPMACRKTTFDASRRLP